MTYSRTAARRRREASSSLYAFARCCRAASHAERAILDVERRDARAGPRNRDTAGAGARAREDVREECARARARARADAQAVNRCSRLAAFVRLCWRARSRARTHAGIAACCACALFGHVLDINLLNFRRAIPPTPFLIVVTFAVVDPPSISDNNKLQQSSITGDKLRVHSVDGPAGGPILIIVIVDKNDPF